MSASTLVNSTDSAGSLRLRLGHDLQALRPTNHNGPGWRVCLWTQGCSIRCTPSCLTPHFLSPAGGWEFETTEVVAAVMGAVVQSGRVVDGITVLGGEPFDQPAPVCDVLRGARSAGLSTMVYSGYRLEALRALGDAQVDACLSEVDVLVDGPYVPERYDDRVAWRGSANQRLLCLSDRFTPMALEEAFARQGKGYSIRVDPDGRARVSGLQRQKATRTVGRLIRSRVSRP